MRFGVPWPRHDREAVEQQSPGPRSAPWVTVSETSATPTGLDNHVTPCETLSTFVFSPLSTQGALARSWALLLRPIGVMPRPLFGGFPHTNDSAGGFQLTRLLDAIGVDKHAAVSQSSLQLGHVDFGRGDPLIQTHGGGVTGCLAH